MVLSELLCASGFAFLSKRETDADSSRLIEH